MVPEGKEQARRIIAEARQVRCSVDTTSALGSSHHGASSRLIKSFDQLLELAETLLSEQELYESRLHRSHHADPGIPVSSAPPH